VGRGVLISTAAVAIGLSYLWLAWDRGTGWVWSAIVHEDGRRTLAGTVWFPRHFLREIPVAVFYLLAIRVSFGRDGSRGVAAARPGAVWYVTAAVALLSIAAVSVVRADGLAVAWADVTQFYARDGVGARGAHWGAHYLSNLGFLAAAWIAATPWRARHAPTWPALLLAGLGAATWWTMASPVDAVFGARAAAHQGRELLTHGLVTLPLALAVSTRRALPIRTALAAWSPRRMAAPAVFLVVVAVVVSTITFAGGALAAVPAPWSARLAAHVFEHTLDLALVVTVCAAWRSAAAQRDDGVDTAGPAGRQQVWRCHPWPRTP
jgi:hypothetical protein